MTLYRVVLAEQTTGPLPATPAAWSREIDADNEFDAVRLAHVAYQAELGHPCACCVGRVTELRRESRPPTEGPPGPTSGAPRERNGSEESQP